MNLDRIKARARLEEARDTNTMTRDIAELIAALEAEEVLHKATAACLGRRVEQAVSLEAENARLKAEVQRLNSVLTGRALAIQPEVDVLRAENARFKTVVDAAKEIVHCTDCDLEGDGHMTRLVKAVRALAAPQTGGDDD